MASRILDFLFGKDPQIFDKKGNVQHDLGKKCWEEWQNRYLTGGEYNWKNHSGTKAPDPRKAATGKNQ